MCFCWQAPLVGKMLCLDEMPQVIGYDDQGKPVCGWVGIKNVWRLSGAFAQKQGVKVQLLMWSYESTQVWLKSHSSESWPTDCPVVYVVTKGCLFGREFVIMTNRSSANLGGVSSEERHTTGYTGYKAANVKSFLAFVWSYKEGFRRSKVYLETRLGTTDISNAS